jgi:hypothetical protein
VLVDRTPAPLQPLRLAFWEADQVLAKSPFSVVNYYWCVLVYTLLGIDAHLHPKNGSLKTKDLPARLSSFRFYTSTTLESKRKA